MKVLDILSSMKVGEIVEDKRILSLFRRLNYIYDYSFFGYLESQWAYYLADYGRDDKPVEHTHTYSGPQILQGCVGTYNKPFDSYSDLIEKFPSSVSFEYKGYKFETTYLDGCFNAYLQLVAKPGNDKPEVSPSMSVFGQIV